MLSPSEFHVGDLASAGATGLTFFKPRSEYEVPMLFAPDEKNIILLGGQFPFHAFEFIEDEARRWAGVVIPGVSIEVDEASVVDSSSSRAPAGCLVRTGTGLICMVYVDDGGWNRIKKVSLIDGLTACTEHQAAAFSRWRIVLGEGEEKRELLAIDLLEEETEAAKS